MGEGTQISGCTDGGDSRRKQEEKDGDLAVWEDVEQDLGHLEAEVSLGNKVEK